MHFTRFNFLKTYQKEKKGKKRNLGLFQTPFQLSSLPRDSPSPLSQVGAADPTQNLFPTG